MDPSDARRRLLAQHDDLRGLLARAMEWRDRLIRGEPVEDQLVATLEQARIAFAEHNALESQWLEPLLASGDAWAPARVARMLEEHGAEHDVFTAFFAGSVLEMAENLPDFVEDIDAHIAAEERTFLHRAVLRDSLVTDGGPSS